MTALYRQGTSGDGIKVEIVVQYPSGKVLCREIGRVFAGLFLAEGWQMTAFNLETA